MPAQKLNVVMLGGKGVGKSSLMAVLYNSLKTDLQETPLIFEALNDTADQLEILYDRLMDFGYTGKPLDGIKDTTDPVEYEFQLAPRNTLDLGMDPDFSLLITFTDYPGEYIRTNQEFVRDKIAHASAVLIAIDTPALMEEQFLHERMNATHYFSSLLRSVFGATTAPRLVLLTPIKCERWLQSTEDTKSMYRKIKNGPYHDLLDNLAQMKAQAPGESVEKAYVAVVITPIQTVGSILFSRFDRDTQGRPVHVWQKKAPDAPFAPVDCDQPLRYLMGFLVKQHLEHQRSIEAHLESIGEAFEKGNILQGVIRVIQLPAKILGQVINRIAKYFGYDEFWSTWFGELIDFFAGNEGFRQAIEAFSKKVKRLPPFDIIQGEHLIA